MSGQHRAARVGAAYRDDDREEQINPDFTRPVRVCLLTFSGKLPRRPAWSANAWS